MKVIRKEDETFESLLGRFKKQEKREKFWIEIKKHKFFVKPSEKKREALKRGIINLRIAERRRKR